MKLTPLWVSPQLPFLNSLLNLSSLATQRKRKNIEMYFVYIFQAHYFNCIIFMYLRVLKSAFISLISDPWIQIHEKKAEQQLPYPRKERKSQITLKKVLRNYSQTVIGGVDLLKQVSKNRGNVKNHKTNSISCHNWPLNVQKLFRNY